MTCNGCAEQVKRVLGKVKGSHRYIFLCSRFISYLSASSFASVAQSVWLMSVCFVKKSMFFYPVSSSPSSEGIDHVEADVENKRVKVKTTLPMESVLETIKKTGKETEFLREAQA